MKSLQCAACVYATTGSSRDDIGLALCDDDVLALHKCHLGWVGHDSWWWWRDSGWRQVGESGARVEALIVQCIWVIRVHEHLTLHGTLHRKHGRLCLVIDG